MNRKDEIVDEVRAARETYAARLDYDLAKMYMDLKAKESAPGRKVANVHPTEPYPETTVSRVNHCNFLIAKLYLIQRFRHQRPAKAPSEKEHKTCQYQDYGGDRHHYAVRMPLHACRTHFFAFTARDSSSSNFTVRCPAPNPSASPFTSIGPAANTTPPAASKL
jgi:hypothetical protein